MTEAKTTPECETCKASLARNPGLTEDVEGKIPARPQPAKLRFISNGMLMCVEHARQTGRPELFQPIENLFDVLDRLQVGEVAIALVRKHEWCGWNAYHREHFCQECRQYLDTGKHTPHCTWGRICEDARKLDAHDRQ